MFEKHKYYDYVSQKRKQWISSNYRASWFKLTVGVVLSLLSVALQLLNPWPLKILVDSVFGHIPAPGFLGSLTGTYELLVFVAFGYLLLYVVSGLLEIADSFLTTWFTNALSIKLQTTFFYHILNLPLETRRKLESGDYVYRLNEQADNLPVLIFSTSVSIVSSIFMIVAALVVLGLLNWQMAAVGVLIVPLMYFSIRHFSPLIESKADDIAEGSSEIYNQSSESIENATLIQAFNRQRFQTKKFAALLQFRARNNLKLNFLNSRFDYTNNILTALGVSLVLLWGGYKVFHYDISLGELLIFITYMSYLYDPLEAILSGLAQYKSLMAGIKRVYEVQSEEADNPDAEVGVRMTKAMGHIVFDNVNFRRDSKSVLEQVNFEILPGQKVAFVGSSGSGKSTILNLLPRFNRVTSGFIYLDGQDISQINLEDLRNQFGVVSQEAELLSGTIHQNIGFAIPDESLDLPDIVMAAEAANAYDFINKLPEGIETNIGESGDNLSGGQKQRISIARAFVKNAPILLLDEPTSALDHVSSTKIISAIRKLMIGKTVLMATHELALLKAMDVVYVIDRGSVTKISDALELETYINSLTKSEESPVSFRFS